MHLRSSANLRKFRTRLYISRQGQHKPNNLRLQWPQPADPRVFSIEIHAGRSGADRKCRAPPDELAVVIDPVRLQDPAQHEVPALLEVEQEPLRFVKIASLP